ncbi:hypothetical protein AA15669_1924 [Saccharibacter floricola DSM 15669]|uniref:Potassium channel domain-containing protein n=1 Tax=Saccharibacter floricola DSM 15669 TaxID=1123227 RepID=A0ABQ0P200_9PROT|nr:hypothetical protein AA15669_1924 [Saccharibacter floricola DSM 15669]
MLNKKIIILLFAFSVIVDIAIIVFFIFSWSLFIIEVKPHGNDYSIISHFINITFSLVHIGDGSDSYENTYPNLILFSFGNSIIFGFSTVVFFNKKFYKLIMKEK